MTGEKLFREVFNESAKIAAAPTLEERLGVNPVFDLMSAEEYAAFRRADWPLRGEFLRAACLKYGVEWVEPSTSSSAEELR